MGNMIKRCGEVAKTLFINRVSIFFLVGYVLFGILAYFGYYRDISIVATSASVFSLSQNPTVSPANELSEIDPCSYKTASKFCELYSVSPLLFLAIVFVFGGFLYYRFRKRFRKLLLLPIITLLLTLPLITTYMYYSAPYDVFNKLLEKAAKDVGKTIDELNNIENNPSSAVLTSSKQIVKRLKDTGISPVIVVISPKERAIFEFLEISNRSQLTFYKAKVIPYTIRSQSYAKGLMDQYSFGILLFPNNTLVVNSFNQEDLAELLPSLSKNILENEYNKYLLKPAVAKNPNFQVLTNDKYLIYQTKKEEERKNGLKTEIDSVKVNIQKMDDVLANNQRIIDAFPKDVRETEEEIDDQLDLKEKWEKNKNECNDFIYYYFECITRVKSSLNIIESNLNYLEEKKQLLMENKKQAEQINKTQVFSKDQDLNYLKELTKNLEELLNNPITPEYQAGIFYPQEKSIFIRYQENKQNQQFTDYLCTSLHEYLHFLSNQKTDEWPVFLEEGFTDYLTRKAFGKQLEPKGEYGCMRYIYETEIAVKLTEYEDTIGITSLYFNDKTERTLKTKLQQHHSRFHYSDFVSKGNKLFFTSLDDVDTKLKLLDDVLATLDIK